MHPLHATACDGPARERAPPVKAKRGMHATQCMWWLVMVGPFPPTKGLRSRHGRIAPFWSQHLSVITPSTESRHGVLSAQLVVKARLLQLLRPWGFVDNELV